MTKLHLVPQGAEGIDGYDKVEVINGVADLAPYAMNECEFILASDILDEVQVDNIPQFLQLLESRMRKGSKLVIGGTDIGLLSRAIIRGDIEVDEANRVVYRGRSCLDLSFVKTILLSLGLSISTTSFQGFRYELETIR
jgi:hypothetical protein